MTYEDNKDRCFCDICNDAFTDDLHTHFEKFHDKGDGA